MKALVIYESMYGNTHAVADAVAAGLGPQVEVRPVHTAGSLPGDVDLLVVGGPTHMHGLTTAMSRKMAAGAGREDAAHVEPGATEEPSLREWLRDLDTSGTKAAAFDTRGDARAALTGSAARGIARRLRRRGCDVLDSQSFLVADAEGPLEEGELDRRAPVGRDLGGPEGRSALTVTAPVIETLELTKRYGEHRGIEEISLEVGAGEVFGFLGPNGAGKTTTIRTLLDLLRPTSGAARVFGLDSRRDSVAIHARLGNLPGEFAADPRLSGREARRPLRRAAGRARPRARRRAGRALRGRHGATAR